MDPVLGLKLKLAANSSSKCKMAVDPIKISGQEETPQLMRCTNYILIMRFSHFFVMKLYLAVDSMA